jgi:hypothetical protein
MRTEPTNRKTRIAKQIMHSEELHNLNQCFSTFLVPRTPLPPKNYFYILNVAAEWLAFLLRVRPDGSI